MPLLKIINTESPGEPRVLDVDPQKILSGNPQFQVWDIDESRGGQVRTGIFEGTPGENVSVKGESFEFCLLLEGVIELTEEGQAPVTLRKGDSFVMKPGYKGVWKTIETARKLFVAVS